MIVLVTEEKEHFKHYFYNPLTLNASFYEYFFLNTCVSTKMFRCVKKISHSCLKKLSATFWEVKQVFVSTLLQIPQQFPEIPQKFPEV